MIHEAIYALYPQVVVIRGEDAFDKDDVQVQYDVSAVNAKATELEAQKQIDIQAQESAKQSAIDKLAKLGLTPDEVKALLG